MYHHARPRLPIEVPLIGPIGKPNYDIAYTAKGVLATSSKITIFHIICESVRVTLALYYSPIVYGDIMHFSVDANLIRKGLNV